MEAKVKTLACLFLSKRDELSVRLIEPPVPEEYQMPEVPHSMVHAARLPGLTDRIRVFKRVAAGALPVYQEL
jgi:hypothetical protein